MTCLRGLRGGSTKNVSRRGSDDVDSLDLVEVSDGKLIGKGKEVPISLSLEMSFLNRKMFSNISCVCV